MQRLRRSPRPKLGLGWAKKMWDPKTYITRIFEWMNLKCWAPGLCWIQWTTSRSPIFLSRKVYMFAWKLSKILSWSRWLPCWYLISSRSAPTCPHWFQGKNYLDEKVQALLQNTGYMSKELQPQLTNTIKSWDNMWTWFWMYWNWIREIYVWLGRSYLLNM